MFLSGTLNFGTSHYAVICNSFLQGNVDQGLFFGEAPLYDINATAGEAQYARLAPQIKKDNTAESEHADTANARRRRSFAQPRKRSRNYTENVQHCAISLVLEKENCKVFVESAFSNLENQKSEKSLEEARFL